MPGVWSNRQSWSGHTEAYTARQATKSCAARGSSVPPGSRYIEILMTADGALVDCIHLRGHGGRGRRGDPGGSDKGAAPCKSGVFYQGAAKQPDPPRPSQHDRKQTIPLPNRRRQVASNMPGEGDDLVAVQRRASSAASYPLTSLRRSRRGVQEPSKTD